MEDIFKIILIHIQMMMKNSMQKIWEEKRNDQLSDLLHGMGESLGFDFDKVHIKESWIFSKGVR